MSRCFPPPAGTTRPFVVFMPVSSPVSFRRHLAQPLEEAPAMALEVECLVDAIVPQVIVQPAHDLCTRGERALVVYIDVVDVHREVLARGASPLRAERAVGALR